MKRFVIAGLGLALAATQAIAQINAGEQKPEASVPFNMTQVGTFNLPWRIAFLPDGRMLITEKVGNLWLVTQQGGKTPVTNVPAVLWKGQGGMLGVYTSPFYAKDHSVYLTYSEPGEAARAWRWPSAELKIGQDSAKPEEPEGDMARWRTRQGRAVRRRGRFFSRWQISLSHGWRPAAHDARPGSQPAAGQDSAPDAGRQACRRAIPMPARPGQRVCRSLIHRRIQKRRRRLQWCGTYTFPGPNLTPSETWTSGHRTPYGLAFAPDGRLWEVEHGPKGGDELNLIQPGKNYGWPLVSYAVNYNDVPIPSPDTRPDLTKPVIYWRPVIAPGNFVFYKGAMFPQWNGSALVSGLASMSLTRITFDGKGGAKPAERWDIGHRIRDVAVAPDGALWMVEDSKTGGLFRVTPK